MYEKYVEIIWDAAGGTRSEERFSGKGFSGGRGLKYYQTNDLVLQGEKNISRLSLAHTERDLYLPACIVWLGNGRVGLSGFIQPKCPSHKAGKACTASPAYMGIAAIDSCEIQIGFL